jgi:Na+-driven multidrug efflux pump
MFGTTLVAVAETSYIGRLGTEPLAAIALVFPFAMLTQMMSAGAMGGGVSSAISRALGAGNRERAATLALHAAMIGACGGIFFTVMMLLFGRQFFSLLGGRGHVLDEACNYSQVLFSGAIAIWLVNTLASVLRGTGDMRLPSATLIVAALPVCRNWECAALPRGNSLRSRSAQYFYRGISSAAAAASP